MRRNCGTTRAFKKAELQPARELAPEEVCRWRLHHVYFLLPPCRINSRFEMLALMPAQSGDDELGNGGKAKALEPGSGVDPMTRASLARCTDRSSGMVLVRGNVYRAAGAQGNIAAAVSRPQPSSHG